MQLKVINLILFILLFGPIPAGAEVFQWFDSSGVSHYSDKAHAGSRQLRITNGYVWYTVRRVLDGDTVILQNGVKVRLLGINTPEIESRYSVAEPGGEEAKRWLIKYLDGKQVRLLFDVEKQDKYKRKLAHLFTRDGIHINRVIVEKGLAFVSIHPPNLRYTGALVIAEKQAEMDKKGIWGRKEYLPKPFTEMTVGKSMRWMRLTGKVKNIHRSRRYTYLEFSRQTDIRIANANLPLFPDLSEYIGKEIEIRGWPSRRKGHYSVLIRHPSAIKYVN